MTAAVSLGLSLAPVNARAGDRGKGSQDSGDQFAHALHGASHRGTRQDVPGREQPSTVDRPWQRGIERAGAQEAAPSGGKYRTTAEEELAAALAQASQDLKSGKSKFDDAAEAIEDVAAITADAQARTNTSELDVTGSDAGMPTEGDAGDDGAMQRPAVDAGAKARPTIVHDANGPFGRQSQDRNQSAQATSEQPAQPEDTDTSAATARNVDGEEPATLQPPGRAGASSGAELHAAAVAGRAGAAKAEPGRPDGARADVARPASASSTTALEGDAAAPQPSDVQAADKPAREGVADALRTIASLANERQSSAPADPIAGRVSVVATQNALAPAPQPGQLLGSTASALVDTLAADESWQSAARDAAAANLLRPSGMTAGTNTLRIQLNPVELGMVTAKLTASGSQLSVELQVESPEARQVLSRDSDQIIKALRAVGFEVDRVTIQQTQPSNGSAMQQNAAGGGREQAASNQQQPAGDSDARRQNGHGGNDAQGGTTSRAGSGEASAARAGSGVYI